MPRWCSLITRVVKPKSAEARCEGVAKAIQQELSNMNSKNVSDTDEVYSLIDILRIPKIPEAMFGRVFFIFGIKNKKLGDYKDLEGPLCLSRVHCPDAQTGTG